jgi:hypothetical protein
MLSTLEFTKAHGPGEFERVETDWTIVADVVITGGPVIVCDPSLYPSGVKTSLLPGDYTALAMLLGYDGQFYVSRLRLVRPNSDPGYGEGTGEVSIDFARVTIGEDARIAAAGARMSPQDVDRFSASLEDSLVGLADWGSVRTPYAACGTFGAGAYPVTLLVDGTETVGVEVDLLGEDRPDVVAGEQ